MWLKANSNVVIENTTAQKMRTLISVTETDLSKAWFVEGIYVAEFALYKLQSKAYPNLIMHVRYGDLITQKTK